MTLHNKAEYNTPDIVAALERHKMTVDKPSVVSDAFRLGWAAHKETLNELHARLKEADTYLEEFGMITVGKSRRTLLKAIAMLEGHMNESSAD